MDKIIGAVKAVFSNYAGFEGRANRGEFWWFTLGYVLIVVILSAIEGVLLGGTSLLSTIFGLAVMLPSIAVGVRRLHDTGHTGWLMLLYLIPLIGWIVLIILSFAKAGQAEANQYGEGPLHPEL